MWRRKEKILHEEQLKQAITDSIQTEKNAMDFYRYAADRTFNDRPRLTFILLAREEREHARSFYNVYRWDDLPPFDDLITIPPDENSDWLQELKEAMPGEFNEEQVLAFAIKRERALEERLRHYAEQIEDEVVRNVYLTNANMTQRHLELITKDYNLAHELD